MFYLFAIGSMFGYAVQQTLLVHHARKIDGLSLAFYRNISFVVTLLPLLYGASGRDIALVLSHWRLLLASGFAGGIYLALLFASYKFLTVGVGTSMSRALSTISVALLGCALLGEQLSPFSLAAIGVILLGTLLLGLQHTHLPHLDSRFAMGMAFVVIGAFPVAFLTYALAYLSRQASPLVSGYFWEISIAFACLVLLGLRTMFFRKPLQKISAKSFFLIAACSWPTLLGTALMSLASRDGPIGIVNAIGSGLLVVSALLAHVLYKEKLGHGQWAAMLLVIVGIVALKFV